MIINTSASVDHECMIEDGVHICPGAHLAGKVSVGRGSWVGIGSSVVERVKIGTGAMIGAGAAVVGAPHAASIRLVRVFMEFSVLSIDSRAARARCSDPPTALPSVENETASGSRNGTAPVRT